MKLSPSLLEWMRRYKETRAAYVTQNPSSLLAKHPLPDALDPDNHEVDPDVPTNSCVMPHDDTKGGA